jgi:hypothetical protein
MHKHHILSEPNAKKKLLFWYTNPHVASHVIVQSRACKRCQKETYILPFCLLCLQPERKLAIRRSTIEDAGLGVFAVRRTGKRLNPREILFDPGDFVCEYGCSENLIDDNEVTARYGRISTQPYTYRTEDDRNYDSSGYRTVGALVNDSYRTCNLPNVEFVEASHSVLVCATRIIHDGDELFVKYGLEYWSEVQSCRYETSFEEPGWHRNHLKP